MESKGALLTVAVPLIAFKVWFAILLLTYAPTRDAAVWIAATVGIFVIGIGAWLLSLRGDQSAPSSRETVSHRAEH